MRSHRAPAWRGKPVLLLSGLVDPIVPAANAGRLAADLIGAGAWLEHVTVPAGHGLVATDIAELTDWLVRVRPSLPAG